MKQQSIISYLKQKGKPYGCYRPTKTRDETKQERQTVKTHFVLQEMMRHSNSKYSPCWAINTTISRTASGSAPHSNKYARLLRCQAQRSVKCYDKDGTKRNKNDKHHGCCRLTKTRTKRNKNHKLSSLISFLEMMRHSNSTYSPCWAINTTISRTASDSAPHSNKYPRLLHCQAQRSVKC